ncbi:MAG: glycosyltransferase [Thermoproteota archaeon]|nr:glycosyltransferase [Thermoproteota archaeon]
MDISVIVPTYLEEDYIGETLNQLGEVKHAAKLKGIESEILVVDSGNDKTFDIAKNLADKVLKFRKRGFSGARNFGASKASGRILLFTDADVRAPANWLEEVSKTFQDPRMVAAVSYTVPYKSLCLSPSERMFYKLDRFYIKTCAKWPFLLRFYSRGDGLAVRKEVFIKVGGFDEKINVGEVSEFLLKLSRIGKVAVLGVPVEESARRLKEWGILKTYLIWWRNYLSYYLLNRPFSNIYSTVRGKT